MARHSSAKAQRRAVDRNVSSSRLSRCGGEDTDRQADRAPRDVGAPDHRRAHDRGILPVCEDYRVDVREDRLQAARGEPARRMLLDYRGREIARPREEAHWPDPELLRRKLELVAWLVRP